MTTESLIETTKTGKKLLGDFESEITSRYLIDGKTIMDWKNHFHVTIPADASMEQIRATSSRIVELISTASFHRAQAQVISDCIDTGSKEEYLNVYEGLVNKYKTDGNKLPGQTTLTNLTESNMKEVTSALSNSNMKLKFWSRIYEGLVEQRKCLETIMWSLHAEMKASNYGT